MTRNGDANTIPSRNNVSERCLGHVATSRARMFIIQSMTLLWVKRVRSVPILMALMMDCGNLLYSARLAS